MNRSLHCERVYNLSNYNTIRFGDMIEDIPEEMALNEGLVDQLRFLQMLNIEIAKNKYIELTKALMNRDDEMELLQQVRIDAITSINELMEKS